MAQRPAKPNEKGSESRKGGKTETVETVQQITLEQLHPFKNHPFKVLDDDANAARPQKASASTV